MDYDDHQREIIESLTWDQMKARMPAKAAQFFTEHHQLLIAYKFSLLGDKASQAEVTQQYFSQMSPDEQYMLVVDCTQIFAELAIVDLARVTVGKIKQTSFEDDIKRFKKYGVNLHLTKESVEVIVRALKDQDSFIGQNLKALQTKEVVSNFLMDRLLEERHLNSWAQKELVEQMRRFYPSIGGYNFKG